MSQASSACSLSSSSMAVLAELDAILEPYKESAFKGKEAAYAGYRNHCQRMANLTLINLQALGALSPRARRLVPVAAAFHDLGIWTSHTWDYIDPSEADARSFMAQRRSDFSEADERVVVRMIAEHHKFFPIPCQGAPAAELGDLQMVECFRRGDWTEVSMGIFKWEATSAHLRQLQAEFPMAGFFALLAGIAWASWLHHPFSNPMPMMKW